MVNNTRPFKMVAIVTVVTVTGLLFTVSHSEWILMVHQNEAITSTINKTQEAVSKVTSYALNKTKVAVSKEKWDVIVCTYMRSGSSFLGKVLGWREDTFYWYEPLWKLFTWQYIGEDGQMCSYTRPTCYKNVGSSVANRSLTFLSDIYNCSFVKHADKINEGIHTTYGLAGPSWKVFRECRKKKAITLKECLVVMETVCRNASHRVTKVLRMDVSYTVHLLEKHPRLKVVLLLRDPRGIMNSHIHTNWFPINKGVESVLRGDIDVLCSRMRRDLAALENMKFKYGDRVRVVQYEDFENPYEKTKNLYEYAGMDIKASETELIQNLTTASEGQTKVGYNPFTYRTSLDWITVAIMKQYCSDIFHKLGLTNYIDPRQLKNLSEPAIKTPLPYAL